MSRKNSDDLFGGMFDINGDEKLDTVEKYLAYNYLEEAAKEREPEDGMDRKDESDGPSRRIGNRSAASSARQNRPSRSGPAVRPLSDTVIPREKYESRVSVFVAECIAAFFGVFSLGALAVVIMWGAADAYDPDNSASGAFSTIILLLGTGFLFLLINSGVGYIRDAFGRMKKTKEEYEKQQSGEEKRDFHTPD